jgi:hypothetical protein
MNIKVTVIKTLKMHSVTLQHLAEQQAMLDAF